MATNTDTLRDLYLDVAGEETITEQQRDQFSHDPIEDDEVATVSAAVEDGLDGAVDGAEVEFESVQ
ncbi:hypothetical protein SAMN05216226_10874 [Halovenus aranensis]|jgi:hypothetical protein|uniref:Uncharacterized protein n=1 Tax=Halovenus aranensis TaxID=890420 RepID=A0A1G8W566_9EURY|nr:hypothetical protein [Halovenus aranensis]SDJ73256.1 hypothetical protein SAMN05216226_10874 [Halovenus aranensis]